MMFSRFFASAIWASVCRRFRRFANNDEVWHRICAHSWDSLPAERDIATNCLIPRHTIAVDEENYSTRLHWREYFWLRNALQMHFNNLIAIQTLQGVDNPGSLEGFGVPRSLRRGQRGGRQGRHVKLKPKEVLSFSDLSFKNIKAIFKASIAISKALPMSPILSVSPVVTDFMKSYTQLALEYYAHITASVTIDAATKDELLIIVRELQQGSEEVMGQIPSFREVKRSPVTIKRMSKLLIRILTNLLGLHGGELVFNQKLLEKGLPTPRAAFVFSSMMCTFMDSYPGLIYRSMAVPFTKNAFLDYCAIQARIIACSLADDTWMFYDPSGLYSPAAKLDKQADPELSADILNQLGDEEDDDNEAEGDDDNANEEEYAGNDEGDEEPDEEEEEEEEEEEDGDEVAGSQNMLEGHELEIAADIEYLINGAKKIIQILRTEYNFKFALDVVQHMVRSLAPPPTPWGNPRDWRAIVAMISCIMQLVTDGTDEGDLPPEALEEWAELCLEGAVYPHPAVQNETIFALDHLSMTIVEQTASSREKLLKALVTICRTSSEMIRDADAFLIPSNALITLPNVLVHCKPTEVKILANDITEILSTIVSSPTDDVYESLIESALQCLGTLATVLKGEFDEYYPKAIALLKPLFVKPPFESADQLIHASQLVISSIASIMANTTKSLWYPHDSEWFIDGLTNGGSTAATCAGGPFTRAWVDMAIALGPLDCAKYLNSIVKDLLSELQDDLVARQSQQFNWETQILAVLKQITDLALLGDALVPYAPTLITPMINLFSVELEVEESEALAGATAKLLELYAAHSTENLDHMTTDLIRAVCALTPDNLLETSISTRHFDHLISAVDALPETTKIYEDEELVDLVFASLQGHFGAMQENYVFDHETHSTGDMSDDQFKNRLDEGDNFAAGIAEFVGHFIRRSPLMIQLLEEDTTTYIDELQPPEDVQQDIYTIPSPATVLSICVMVDWLEVVDVAKGKEPMVKCLQEMLYHADSHSKVTARLATLGLGTAVSKFSEFIVDAIDAIIARLLQVAKRAERTPTPNEDDFDIRDAAIVMIGKVLQHHQNLQPGVYEQISGLFWGSLPMKYAVDELSDLSKVIVALIERRDPFLIKLKEQDSAALLERLRQVANTEGMPAEEMGHMLAALTTLFGATNL